MEFLPKGIEDFVLKNTEAESEILQKINRNTHLKMLSPRMLSGHFQGRVLSLLSHMIQPENILEIGTYTGYSAICLAEGLKSQGKLITIDINDELEEFVKNNIKEAGFENQIEVKIGKAVEVIPQLNQIFDLVFIDADKTNYSNYYDLVFGKVKKGGYIIADNVLWSGKVIEKKEKFDKDTQAMIDYCSKIQNDNRVQNVLFPIRDGLMICRKK